MKEENNLDVFEKFRWFERLYCAALAMMGFSAYAAVRFLKEGRNNYAVVFAIFIFLFWLGGHWWNNCFIERWGFGTKFMITL